MIITDERIEMLTATLLKDTDFANEILAMEAADAAAALKAKGFDFTAEELSSFAEGLAEYLEENAELSEDDLDDVNGGCYHHHHHHHRHHHHHHHHHHYHHYCCHGPYRGCRW